MAAVVIVSALAPASARAQGQDADGARGEDRRRAAVLLDRSAIAYREGRHGAAAVLLEEAHLLSAEPILLYNLGRAYEGAADRARALDAYRRFLEAVPDAMNAETVRERIASIEASLEEEGAERSAREAAAIAREADARADRRARTERARREREERRGSPVPWLLAAGGGAAIGAAIGLGALAGDHHASARVAERQVDASAYASEATTLAVASNVTLVAGAALAAAGLTWGLIVLTEPEGEELDVAIGPASIAVRGAF